MGFTIGAGMCGVAVLGVCIWLLLGQPGRLLIASDPEVSPVSFQDVPEASTVSFQDVLATLDENSRLTNLQRDEKLKHLEGKQVHWYGWVDGVEDGIFDRVTVFIWSEAIAWEKPKWSTRERLVKPDSSHFALLKFDSRHRPALLELKSGQMIRVSCIFRKHVYGTTVSLKKCNLVTGSDPE